MLKDRFVWLKELGIPLKLELVERFVAANPDEANFTTIVACKRLD